MASFYRQPPPLIQPGRYDPAFQAEIERLHCLLVRGRWGAIALLWLIFLPFSLWRLQGTLVLLRDTFTWSGLRYILAFHPLASLGLFACLSSTAAVLLWQSRNILWGLPEHEIKTLEKRTLRIRQQGKSHPLWTWICHTKE